MGGGGLSKGAVEQRVAKKGGEVTAAAAFLPAMCDMLEAAEGMAHWLLDPADGLKVPMQIIASLEMTSYHQARHGMFNFSDSCCTQCFAGKDKKARVLQDRIG